MTDNKSLVATKSVERSIIIIRAEKVILDTDLAELYDVSVGRLNEAVRRNKDRFPEDFMFQLTRGEFEKLKVDAESMNLKSQTAISSSGWGGRRHPPHAFSEQGVAMLSSVLRSKRAVMVNIEIMRAFVRMRQMLASQDALAQKLDNLEKKYNAHLKVVFDAIRQLMEPPVPEKRQVGFHWEPREKKKKKPAGERSSSRQRVPAK